MSKKIKIKAVIFDLGGVIVHGGYLNFIKRYCSACLTSTGKKRLWQLERKVNIGEITERTFYTEISKVFGVHMPPKRVHEYIVSRMKADEPLIRLIPKIKKAKVALFTNSIGHMASEVLRKRRIPTRRLFTRVFDSSNLHMIKPDPGAYRFVLHKLKVRPHEALMVDDRILNIRGAQKIGMQGIIYKNSRQFKKALSKYDLA